jgi:hypothetical protein
VQAEASGRDSNAKGELANIERSMAPRSMVPRGAPVVEVGAVLQEVEVEVEVP